MRIYMIKNMINNKVYIGQTVNSLLKRRKGHIADAKRGKNTKIARALNKYGFHNFIFGEICSCNIEELDNKELEYIQLYKAIDDNYGYNIKIGGENNFKTSDETKKKISIKSKLAAQKAKENGGHWLAGKKMSEERKKHLSEVLSSDKNPKNKEVLMFSKSGDFIKKFHSASEAGRQLNKQKGNIINCCNNKIKSAYGYKWKYEENLTMV